MTLLYSSEIVSWEESSKLDHVSRKIIISLVFLAALLDQIYLKLFKAELRDHLLCKVFLDFPQSEQGMESSTSFYLGIILFLGSKSLEKRNLSLHPPPNSVMCI